MNLIVILRSKRKRRISNCGIWRTRATSKFREIVENSPPKTRSVPFLYALKS